MEDAVSNGNRTFGRKYIETSSVLPAVFYQHIRGRIRAWIGLQITLNDAITQDNIIAGHVEEHACNVAFHHRKIANRASVAIIEDVEVVLQVQSFQVYVIDGACLAWSQGQFSLNIRAVCPFVALAIDGDGLLYFTWITEGSATEDNDISSCFG